MMHIESPEPSTSNFIADDDDDIASHVELSSDGMPTQWYHQHEHDYLKNIPEMEPESSGMDMDTVGDIVDDTAGIELIENDNAIEGVMGNVYENPQRIINAPVTRIAASYDTELPQEIFHKNEPQTAAFSPNGSVLINNFMKQEEPVVVVEQPARYNQVVMQEDQSEGQYHNDTFVMEEAEIDSGNAFHGMLALAMNI
jgi:hypothetical protein